MKNFGKGLFCFVALLLVSAQFIFDAKCFNIFSKPWHLQPFAHEDSLSDYVKMSYKVLEKNQVYSHFVDSSKTVVNILVDAWGLPMDDSMVKEDFALFENVPHEFAVHHRQLNYNMHAEKAELRNNYENTIFLFGGDSLEYDRKTYIPQIGFSKVIFCQNCSDFVMADKLDSVLCTRDTLQSPLFVGFTTQSSRGGNRDSLLSSIKIFANLSEKHPDVIFVIQGTHRPILGTPETRRMFYAHWVPAVAINAKEMYK